MYHDILFEKLNTYEKCYELTHQINRSAKQHEEESNRRPKLRTHSNKKEKKWDERRQNVQSLQKQISFFLRQINTSENKRQKYQKSGSKKRKKSLYV